MPHRRISLHPFGRHAGGTGYRPAVLAGGMLAGLTATLLLAPQPAPAAQAAPATKVLYTLSTQCALQGAAPVPCTVEAVDAGGATLYRHRIGTGVETVRITAEPVTMAIWANDTKQWRPLRGASARFSTNTVCFNGKDLCVVNPNYLNSVREDRANTRLQGRDLVMVHFGSDGRVDASCYDDACALLLK
ncbi:hypothetical protein [Cyanobium gracile]|uniref:Secreted protein n=1 Tax=Cyanobium gracile UHCC 0281 TaxID=3110309 RepID=A0ABU5SRP1_9CYAN|nr:hypothetical protein [Cyanobium gracile]MEA5441166.1 hypothetical protein [Cyanobium gracile UHCC 0281]